MTTTGTTTLLLLLAVLSFLFYLLRDLDSDAGQWTWRRTLLLFLPLFAFLLYGLYKGSESVDLSDPSVRMDIRLRSFGTLLSTPAFWAVMFLCFAFGAYAFFLDRSATALQTSVDDLSSAPDDGPYTYRSPKSERLSAVSQFALTLLNLSILLLVAFGVMFAAGWVLDWLQFQRSNSLGMLSQLMVYLPCKVFGWFAKLLGASSSSPSSTAVAPPLAIVATVIMVSLLFGLQKLLNVRRTWQNIRAHAKDLAGVSEDGGGQGGGSTTTIEIVPPEQTVRLHRVWRENLGVAVQKSTTTTTTAAATNLGRIVHTYGIRFRLFLNSQQHTGFFSGESKNVLTFGEFLPSSSASANSSVPENYLELRASNRGLIVGSAYFAEGWAIDTPITAVSLQRWHDVVVECGGSNNVVTVSVDGELLFTAPMTRPPTSAYIVPDAIFFTIGNTGLNGVVSDVAFVPSF